MATDAAPKQSNAPTKSKTPSKTAAKARPRTRAATARTRATATPRKRALTASQASSTRTTVTGSNGNRVIAGVLDAQEQAAKAVADYQTRAGEASRIPGAATLAHAQAQLLLGVTDAYVSAARKLLR